MFQSNQKIAFKIFVSSPGGMENERKVLRESALELNAREQSAFSFELFLHEIDAPSELHADKQKSLAGIAENSDLYFGMMWLQPGTETTTHQSGTIEEFYEALTSFIFRGSPRIMFLFCERPFFPRRATELDSLAEVLKFRTTVGQLGLREKTFKDTDELRAIVRNDIPSAARRGGLSTEQHRVLGSDVLDSLLLLIENGQVSMMEATLCRILELAISYEHESIDRICRAFVHLGAMTHSEQKCNTKHDPRDLGYRFTEKIRSTLGYWRYIKYNRTAFPNFFFEDVR